MKESERLKLILDVENITMKELAEKTGTKRLRWSHLKQEKAKLRAEDGEALKIMFPEYQVWFMTEIEIPEYGHLSPLTKLQERVKKES